MKNDENEKRVIFKPPQNEKEGVGLLVCEFEPYNVAKPFMFKEFSIMENFLKKHNLFEDCVRISGYNILIVWVGRDRHMFESIPSGKMITDFVLNDLKLMAEYYEKTKITKNAGYFKRYRT